MISTRGSLAGLLLLTLTGSLSAHGFGGRVGFVGGTIGINRGLSITFGAGFGPGFGYGYAYGFGAAPQMPQAIPFAGPPQPQFFNPLPVNGFDRIDDLNRQNNFQPMPPVPPKKKDDPKPPPKPGELPPPPQADPNPKVEQPNQLKLGQEAFAQGQYGRAAHHFRVAVKLLPDEAIAHFLLAQSLFATLKYDEAFEAIKQGLRRQPDWPMQPFRPLALYGANVADYPEQLRSLEDVLSRNPNSAVLLFLMGYQLWFDGRQEEAMDLFQRSAAGLPDPALAEVFLKHRPPGFPLL
jgi:hypothetical protein